MPITPNLTSLTLNTIPEEIFLVLGGLSGGDDATDQKSNFIFGKRIADNEKVLIGPNNIWQSGKYDHENIRPLPPKDFTYPNPQVCLDRQTPCVSCPTSLCRAPHSSATRRQRTRALARRKHGRLAART